MNKLRPLILTIFLTCLSTLLYAVQIDEADAFLKAQTFYQSKVGSMLRSAPSFQLAYTCRETTSLLKSANTSNYFYIFNVGNEQGFVIVSGDDATKTILGYSNEGAFSVNNMPENVKSWLDFYQSEIKSVTESGLSSATSNGTAVSTSLQTTTTVSPLLGNIKWNQSDPFNLLCPGSPHAVTGCVATAMAQIMKYHQWPVTGYGSAQYATNNYETLSVDFSKTSYDWNNMLESYGSTSTGKQDSAVATLMYHCGVSANMEYSTSSSSASINNAATALIDHFGYDADIQMPYRNLYDATDWTNLIKNELDNARPVLYTGQNEDGGHAFVCDGYDSNDLFHINWGWGGLCNGYFELSSLEPSSAGIGGSIGGYSSDQVILVGIQKEDHVANATYLPGIGGKGLTSSTTSLTNKSNTFTASFTFFNFGLNPFYGKVGVGLYKNGNWIKELDYATILQSKARVYLSGYSYTFPNPSLSGISTGSYQIFCNYQAPNSTSWEIMKCPASLNNYLNVTIATDNSVKITKPASAPALALTQPIEKLSNVYQNKITKFTLAVQNTGTDFYSNIGVNIYSSTGTLVGKITGVASISAGETKIISLSDSIKYAPGSYYAVAVYDSTNAFSEATFKKIGPTAYEQIPFTVLAEPSAAALTLSNNISLLNATSTIIRKSETFTLNVPIRNAGGYFGSKVTAYVFPGSGGYALTYFSTDAYIDSNTSENIEIKGSMDIDPGNYYFSIYYGSDNTSFTPSSYRKLNFTLSEQVTDLKKDRISDFIIYPNPIRNVLNIKTSETVIQAQVLDLSGRIRLKFLNTNSLDVKELKSGIYMIRIETENGIKTEKFIKE